MREIACKHVIVMLYKYYFMILMYYDNLDVITTMLINTNYSNWFWSAEYSSDRSLTLQDKHDVSHDTSSTDTGLIKNFIRGRQLEKTLST